MDAGRAADRKRRGAVIRARAHRCDAGADMPDLAVGDLRRAGTTPCKPPTSPAEAGCAFSRPETSLPPVRAVALHANHLFRRIVMFAAAGEGTRQTHSRSSLICNLMIHTDTFSASRTVAKCLNFHDRPSE